MAKTEAEIREEIRKEEEAKRAEIERKREEEANRRSIFESIGGFLSGGFGSILGILILGLLVYTIGQTKWGQELIEKGVSYLPEDWQVKAHGFLDMVGINTDMGPSLLAMADKDLPGLRKLITSRGVPADVVSVIARDKDTFAAYLKTVQDANRDDEGKPGKINPTTMMNDKTIFELMTKQPVLVKLLAEGALKSGAGQNSGTAKNITEALRSIVASERVDTLLNGEHRENTLNLIKQIAKANNSPISDEQLAAVLQVGLDASGKSTPNFRTFLSEALTRNDKGELQVDAALKNFADKEPTLAKRLFKAMLAGPAAAPAPGQPATPATEEAAIIAAIKAVPKNAKALQGLSDSLSDAENTQLLFLLKGNDPVGTMKFALAHRPQFDAFIKASDVTKLPDAIKQPLLELAAIPPKAEKPILAILNKGIDPRSLLTVVTERNGSLTKLNPRHLVTQLLDENNRKLVAAAGPDNVAELIRAYAPNAPAAINAANITAVLKATQAIADNPKMADATVRRDTVRVTAALADMLMNEKSTELQKLKPAEIANFFNDPVNSAALKQLLADTRGLPDKQQAMAQALLAHFDMIERVAADKEKGAPFLLEALDKASKKKPDADTCKNPTKLDSWVAGGIDFAGTDMTWTGTKDNIIGKNAEEIKHLLVDLQVADCAGPASTPNVRTTAVTARHSH